MALRLKANRRFPSVPVVTDNTENHTQVLMAVKEALDIGQRRTGDLLNSFIRVEDLIDLGLITIEGNTTAIVGADLSEIANIGDLSGAAAGDFLRFDGTNWVNDQLALADITQAMVTQHQAALQLTASQITDLEDIDPTWAGDHAFLATAVFGGTTAQLDAVPDQPYAGMPIAIYSNPFIAGFSTQNAFFSTRYAGSLTSPTAVTSGLTLGGFSGLGYDGSVTARGAFFSMLAAEAWSGSGRGGMFEFRATPIGSTTDAGITANRILQLGIDATSGYARGATGAVGQPFYSFFDDSDTGIYRPGANELGVAANGTLIATFASTGPYIGVTPGEIAGITGLPISNTGMHVQNSPFALGVATAVRYNAGRIQGSLGAPAAISNGLTMCAFAGYGYDGATMAEGGGVFIAANGLWSGTSHPVRLDFHAVATDSAIALSASTVRAVIAANADGAYFRMGVTANGGDGVVTQPAFSWSSDTDTGLYRIGANHMAVAAGAARVFSAQLSGTTRLATVGDGTNAVQLVFSGAAGSVRDMVWASAGAGRWIGRANTTAESGGNAGSDFEFNARDDAGNSLLNAWTAIRATGQMRFRDGTTALPSISFQSDTDTGWYRIGADNLAISTGGALHWDINTTRVSHDLQLRINVTDAIYSSLLFDYSGEAAPVVGDPIVAQGSFTNLGVGGAPTYVMARANTSLTGPTAVSSNQRIGQLRAMGYDGDEYALGGQIYFTPQETFSETARGTRFEVGLVPTGSATVSSVFRLIANATGSAVQGQDGAVAQPYYSFVNDTDSGIFSQAANAIGIAANGGEVARFDADATAGNTRFLIYDVDNGTLERVSVGAADSGGAGFKVLRIPN